MNIIQLSNRQSAIDNWPSIIDNRQSAIQPLQYILTAPTNIRVPIHARHARILTQQKKKRVNGTPVGYASDAGGAKHVAIASTLPNMIGALIRPGERTPTHRPNAPGTVHAPTHAVHGRVGASPHAAANAYPLDAYITHRQLHLKARTRTTPASGKAANELFGKSAIDNFISVIGGPDPDAGLDTSSTNYTTPNLFVFQLFRQKCPFYSLITIDPSRSLLPPGWLAGRHHRSNLVSPNIITKHSQPKQMCEKKVNRISRVQTINEIYN